MFQNITLSILSSSDLQFHSSQMNFFAISVANKTKKNKKRNPIILPPNNTLHTWQYCARRVDILFYSSSRNFPCLLSIYRLCFFPQQCQILPKFLQRINIPLFTFVRQTMFQSAATNNRIPQLKAQFLVNILWLLFFHTGIKCYIAIFLTI